MIWELIDKLFPFQVRAIEGDLQDIALFKRDLNPFRNGHIPRLAYYMTVEYNSRLCRGAISLFSFLQSTYMVYKTGLHKYQDRRAPGQPCCLWCL